MRKKFEKPMMKKICIDYSENIATSEPAGPPGTVGAFSLNWADMVSCYVFSSGVFFHQINESNFILTYPCLVTGVSPQSAAFSLGIRP